MPSRARLQAALAASCLLLALGCRSTPSVTSSPTAAPATSATPVSFLGLPDHDEHRGQLRAFFGQKYSKTEIAAARSTVDEVLGYYPAAEKNQAVAEILAFNYVVFHITSHHRLEHNHRAIRNHEKLLRDLCQRHQLPLLPVLAIVSWENSGDTQKVSWADAAGLGQMTWGAIEQAHRFAEKQASELPAGDPQRDYLEKTERRHRYLAKKAKQPDERFLPECNLEDVVLFFKYLYTQYGGLADHAIGAYHKGQANHDDILRDYLKRKNGSCPDPLHERPAFIEAIKRQPVTYLSLWNDPRSREMLNGLRTLDGDPTTSANASEALGDESDIYPWKVLGSLTAYRQGEEFLLKQQSAHEPPQIEVESRGLPRYDSPEAITRALKNQTLVHTRAPIQDLGIDHNVSEARRSMAYSVTPELEGYLWGLTQRWRQRAGDTRLRLPVARLLAVGDLAGGKRGVLDQAQLRGITVQIDASHLEEKPRAALRREIEEDYLLDRVYRSTLKNKNVVLSLNPRFGHEFMDLYDKFQKGGGEVASPHDLPRPAPTPEAAPGGATTTPQGEL